MSLPLEQAQFTINQLLRQHAQGPTGSTVPGYDEALAKARYEAMLRHARTIYDSAGDAQTQQQDQAMQQAQHAEELRRAQQDEQIRQAQHVENIRRMQMDHAISTQSIVPGTNGTGTQQPFDGMAPTGPFIPDGKGYSAPYVDQPAYPGPFTPTGKGSYPTAPWDVPAYPGPFTPTGKGYTPFNPWDIPAYPGPFTPDTPTLPPATTIPTVVPAPPAEVVPYTGGPATKSATPGGSWNTPSLFKGTESTTGVTSTKPVYDTGFTPWGVGRTDIMRGGSAFGGFGSSTKPTTDTWRPDTSYNQASRNPGYGTGTNPAWMNFMGGAPSPVLDQRYNSYVSTFGQPTWTANG